MEDVPAIVDVAARTSGVTRILAQAPPSQLGIEHADVTADADVTATPPIVKVAHKTLFASQPLAVRRATTSTATRPTMCDALRLMYISRGFSTLTYESGQLELPLDSLVRLPAERWYFGTPAHDVETLTVYLATEFVHDQVKWLPHSAPFLEQLLTATEPVLLRPHPLHRPKLRHHLQSMADASVASPNAEFVQMSRLSRLLAALHPAPGGPAAHGYGRAEVDAAVHVLNNDLQSAWSIERLARAVALSPSQLSRLFTQYVAMSPSRFLREARAHRMRELLLTGMSIGQIGSTVGWPNPSHAARAYRAVFGLSPHQSKSSRDVLVER